MTANTLSNGASARLNLFGTFRLSVGAGELVTIASRRARALIAYLGMARDHTAPRERLAGLLWSDRGEPQARASLRQCLLEIRKALEGPGLQEIIELDRERVRLRTGACAIDVVELEQALADSDCGGLARALDEIGPERLLDDLNVGGLYGEWLEQTRAHLDRRIGGAVHGCLTEHESAGAWPAARALAEAYLRRDPMDEAVVAAAMRADAALGSTGSAHRRFEILKSALAKEYGIAPGQAAREALASIDEHRSPQASATAAAPAGVIVAAPPTGDEGAHPPIVIVAAFECLHDADANLARTLREEVVSGLSRFRDMRVIADPRAMADVGTDTLPDRAPGYVLGGSLRSAESGAVVTGRLVRLGDARVIWSDQLALPNTGIIETIDRVIAKVVGAVLPTIDADVARRTRGIPADGAYERYVVARDQAAGARAYDEASKAADALESLIQAEPGFPLPYLPLARLYNTDFSYTRAGASGPDQRARALELAKTALALDRGHVHGYTVTGWCYLWRRQWESAELHFNQAMLLNPFHADRVMEVGYGQIFLGDLERARTLLDRCLVLNPLPADSFFQDLGLLELVRQDHDRADSYFDLIAHPTIWSPIYRALNGAMAGRPNKAAAEAALQQICGIWPSPETPTPEAVGDWIIGHHPFRLAETEARFREGVRQMLG